MEAFFALLALCAGNSSVTVEFPSKRQMTWSFDVVFDLRLNKRLSKQSRSHRANYNVTGMWGWCINCPSKISLIYRKTSSISCTKYQSLNISCILLKLSSLNPLKPGVKDENEDVVGAAPTGDAPTTSELSTIFLPTKVRLILEVLR